MKIYYGWVLILVLGLFLSGCTSGLIYTHTVRPLDLNQHDTSVAAKDGEGDIRHLQYYVSVTWGSNAIGEIAEKNGIETIYYADLETLIVFLGLWREFTVHIYGK